MPVARQGGRELSAPRPYVTDPFHPLSSIYNMKQFVYIYKILQGISCMWYIQVCLGTVFILKLRMRSCSNTLVTSRMSFSFIWFILLRIGPKQMEFTHAYLLDKRHDAFLTMIQVRFHTFSHFTLFHVADQWPQNRHRPIIKFTISLSTQP